MPLAHTFQPGKGTLPKEPQTHHSFTGDDLFQYQGSSHFINEDISRDNVPRKATFEVQNINSKS